MKTFIAFTLRFALLSAIATSSIAGNTQSSSSIEQENSLAVSLAMQETQVPIGKSPWAILTVKNLVDHDVIIHGSMYRIYVEGKAGEPSTTRVQRQMTGRLRRGEAPLRAGENALWTIAPEQSGVHKFQLAYLYDLNAAGRYTVYAEVHDPSSKKWLRTNTVHFEMLAPPK